jgi:hypothetical protein
MIEIQDIFNQYGDEYRNNHKLPLHILKTMVSIEACRTAELGGHVDEFIRRFLMHVLPRKFVKIRHYGILSNRNRSTKLQKCKELTGTVQNKKQNSEVKLNASELLLKLTGKDINVCSCCGKGKMMTKDKLNRQNYSPPGEKNKIA